MEIKTIGAVAQKINDNISRVLVGKKNEIDLVLFFRDSITQRKNREGDDNLFRLCDVHNIPVATNMATAEVLIHGLDRGDLDWRNIVNPK